MGEIHTHIPVKLFTAISYSKGIAVSFLMEKLTTLFGEIDSESAVFKVDSFTSYYQKEMGRGLSKKIVSFKRLIAPDKLPQIKVTTNRLEAEQSVDGNRRVNIDPGYLTQAKVVLATTKDYSHRLYMSRGIFADLHLNWSAKSFRPQPWTYPDYAQEAIIAYFNDLRRIYLSDLSQQVSK